MLAIASTPALAAVAVVADDELPAVEDSMVDSIAESSDQWK